jgi:hypothetical protein
MKYIKYLILLPVLILVHTFLSGYWLILAWCCTGLLLPLWFSGERHFFLRIFLWELLTGAVYCLFYRSAAIQLYNWAEHLHIAMYKLAATIVLIQSVTALLCISTFFYISRLVLHNRYSFK